MEGSQLLFRIIGWVAVLFGFVLLVLPSYLVARKAQPWAKIQGLMISGGGFLLLGFGFLLAHEGRGGVIPAGIVMIVLGHFWQYYAAARGTDDS